MVQRTVIVCCLATISLGRLWTSQYNEHYDMSEIESSVRLATNALNEGNLSEDQLTCLKERDKVLQLGEDLYYSTAFSNTTRSSCQRFDTLYAQWTPAGTHRFHECMDHLEESQKQLKAHDNLSYTCSDCPDLIHATWKGPLPPTARVGILSFLHAYPKGCVKLKLWVTDAATEESLRANLPSHESIEILYLNFTFLSNSIMAAHPGLQDVVEKSKPHLAKLSSSTATTPVGYSDIVRVFLLAAHGGIYLDCDTLLLKPLTPLMARDFYYRWQVRNLGNTAVMHLRLGSPNAAFLINVALKRSNYGKSEKLLAWVLHPHQIHKYLNRIPQSSVEMLPSAYFDPLWVIMNNAASKERYGLAQFADFFTESNTRIRGDSTESFFSGAFAFHWHNQWRSDIVTGSTADLFLKRYEEMSP